MHASNLGCALATQDGQGMREITESDAGQAKDEHVVEDRPIAYSVAEAAKQVKSGRSKLYQEIKAGKLVARKLGRKTLILDEDLRAYAKSLPRM
jgi:excisionase family DNA binding protein